VNTLINAHVVIHDRNLTAQNEERMTTAKQISQRRAGPNILAAGDCAAPPVKGVNVYFFAWDEAGAIRGPAFSNGDGTLA
jgi:hypothetical protein